MKGGRAARAVANAGRDTDRSRAGRCGRTDRLHRTRSRELIGGWVAGQHRHTRGFRACDDRAASRFTGAPQRRVPGDSADRAGHNISRAHVEMLAVESVACVGPGSLMLCRVSGTPLHDHGAYLRPPNVPDRRCQIFSPRKLIIGCRCCRKSRDLEPPALVSTTAGETPGSNERAGCSGAPAMDARFRLGSRSDGLSVGPFRFGSRIRSAFPGWS